MSFKIGENIGPYRITEQLGQGGMATVYKAYHASLDRYVAMKVMHSAFNEDQSFIMRFQREARVVAKLEHAHIVPVYDFAEHEGRPYLVMKFIEGDTLKARLMQGPLSADEITKVVNSVGSALGYAHQQGILHRDIKPSNVILANDGVMYLADFGLARIAQAGESTLSSDSIMGTPQYISPEQAMGKKDLDAGTDIYSFAVMLYEMVVGQVPFSADTPFSVIHDHIYTPLPMPRSINPKIPESVERVLLKALAKERKDRHASVEDLMTAFKNAWVEAGVPIRGTVITMRPQVLDAVPAAPVSTVSGAAAPASATQPTTPKKKRSFWKYLLGAGILFICCILTIGILDNRKPNNQPANLPTFENGIPAVPAIASPELAAVPTPTFSAELQAAIEKVRANPNDAFAHLDLSLAYYDAGQKRLSFEELLRGTELAKDNKDFYTQAEKKFREREEWIAVSASNMRLINLYKSAGEKIPEQTMTGFREATYKAAENPQLKDYVFFDRISNIDKPFGLIVQGRYALFNGSSAEAQIYLDDAADLMPNVSEVLLLQSEIYLKQGNNDEAKVILTILKANLVAPDWLRRMADDYYRAIP